MSAPYHVSDPLYVFQDRDLARQAYKHHCTRGEKKNKKQKKTTQVQTKAQRALASGMPLNSGLSFVQMTKTLPYSNWLLERNVLAPVTEKSRCSMIWSGICLLIAFSSGLLSFSGRCCLVVSGERLKSQVKKTRSIRIYPRMWCCIFLPLHPVLLG